MNYLIETNSLSFRYQDDGSLLRYPDFQLSSGEFCAVVGHSGCGKTTFMHLISLLLKPTEGSVIFGGFDSKKSTLSQINQIRGAKTGMLFQQNWLVKSLTVEENIKSACFFSRKAFDKNYFLHLCRAVSITDLLAKYPHELSGGERQRAALVRAMIHRPEVIFADEPTSQADDANAVKIANLLTELAKQSGASLVVITHDKRIKPCFVKIIDLSTAKQ